MNSKDKEAFEKSLDVVCNKENDYQRFAAIWQAACEYMNKEVKFYKATCATLSLRIDRLIENDDRLQAENKKLREALNNIIQKDFTRVPCPDNKPGCLVLHYGNSELGLIAIEALKEQNDK